MGLYLILALIALVILMWAHLDSDDYGFMVLQLFVLVVVLLAFGEYEGSPKAIDVYRGKTALEITYKDSIPIDSVVVFK